MEKKIAISPLKAARKSQGLSQIELADYIGVSQASLSDFENCVITPTPANAEKLVGALGGRISEMEILYPRRFMTGEFSSKSH
ncbi:helix-turn-helix domain-containing protein [Deefgea piscis]|uniref:helix-turn-helix domain-containing protein n=1 Tax=Deefgea piscis TaxID=2739061 RepID=UPI001C809AFB|nr:helix-turn-helix transcriptional regulator [Deefgea piscis]QZA80872.1 helix-turn-helix transcriptional regulator [Deefgea piscis]